MCAVDKCVQCSVSHACAGGGGEERDQRTCVLVVASHAAPEELWPCRAPQNTCRRGEEKGAASQLRCPGLPDYFLNTIFFCVHLGLSATRKTEISAAKTDLFVN